MGLDDQREAYSLEQISICAELITEILLKNRVTINLIFEDIKNKIYNKD